MIMPILLKNEKNKNKENKNKILILIVIAIIDYYFTGQHKKILCKISSLSMNSYIIELVL